MNTYGFTIPDVFYPPKESKILAVQMFRSINEVWEVKIVNVVASE